MKRNVFVYLVALSMSMLFISQFGYAKQNKIPKVYKKLQKKAERMMHRGAFAFVGIAVSDQNRIDNGRTKAYQDAVQKMTQSKKNYVETTVSDLREELGVGKGNTEKDVFKSLSVGVAANLLKGARIVDFQSSQSRSQKRDKTMTYYVLVVITPKYTYQTLLDELEKMKDKDPTLYQRFMNSQVQKTQQEKIKEFEEEFGIND